ncbi:hypothetical protein DFH08DRAFT_949025 [Mycena albidolilacea]|uniref:Uncharacterized protein n=1 Tax=Mycena albidolilacea TaxID=1033008 RepID=A0AAD7AS94_9AGAR|nr:hypothetical protein DFH08DRAFT_949025 [Mycena albidolilacea]
MSSINLQGKASRTFSAVAIITGTSSGVGLATAKVFLAAGCSVMGADISPAPDSIRNATGFAFTQGDLTKVEMPRALVEACQKKFGDKIDILLNVAGIMDSFASVETVTQAEYERVMAVNLNAPIWLMHEVVKVMKVHKAGAIVNVSSKAGMSGAAAGLAYTTSKHALIGATKSTAWLLKSAGIRCNAICPGMIATNMAASVDGTNNDMQSLAAVQPNHALIGNVQTGEGVMPPETVANVLLFLASDLSKDINGAVLPVDNGWSVV